MSQAIEAGAQARTPWGSGPAARTERTRAADALARSAYEQAGGSDQQMALVAVGGYGRGDLSPHSDLDVVLVGADGVDLTDVAARIWYTFWETPADGSPAYRLDHAVRSLGEMSKQAEADVKVALGLLDVRHLAGDPGVTLQLRSTVLAQWRRDARSRLPELAELTRRRHDTLGELAHASVPDLKEGEGGLRDAVVLRSLVATWLIDVPHTELERSRVALSDVRDVLHRLAGRATDRIAPEMWAALAEEYGVEERAVQQHVREHGRRLAHLSHLAWRRVDRVLGQSRTTRRERRPDLVPLAPGVALSDGEVVLAAGARPDRDPVLLLAAAALAAERDVVLAPATAARLVRECPPLPDPWPDRARDWFVRLLASGPGLRAVWETLEETGATKAFLPEWDRVRLLPHASVIHRWTVDRHMVETCVEASALIRGVARPDVLMVAALLHDIGKGGLVEHSVAGEPVARAIALRMGFDDQGADLVARLVRHHLVLAQTASSRDPDDPETPAHVRRTLVDPQALPLLAALTQADARATAPQVWSAWRATLVARLVARTAEGWCEEGATGPVVEAEPEVVVELLDGPSVHVEETEHGATLTVAAPDRLGLLADIAATLALLRLPVRSARAWSVDHHGLSSWEIGGSVPDAAVVRDRLRAVVAGEVDRRRLRVEPDALVPGVVVRPDASTTATVLEVRTADRVGVLYQVCSTLAGIGVSVRSAHVDTVGPQAVDVFYVQEPGAGALSETRAASAAHAVRASLTPAE
ncbi:MAG: [protein-PII] uridylyltransferase [Nocardioides sp.]|uniref:[protein-PII] uridylyltransferase n=1 Tax=Nocardioides sp. TaxID=35761 RepID=UPI003EFDB11E